MKWPIDSYWAMPIEESMAHFFQARWSHILKLRDCLFSVKHGTNQSMLLLNGDNDQGVLTLSITLEALETTQGGIVKEERQHPWDRSTF